MWALVLTVLLPQGTHPPSKARCSGEHTSLYLIRCMQWLHPLSCDMSEICMSTYIQKIANRNCANSFLKNIFVVPIQKLGKLLNSLTPKSVPAGTKNSRSEGVLLTKHKHTNIPTMMEPFPPPAPWFWWRSVPHTREPLQKGLDEATIKGFNKKL